MKVGNPWIKKIHACSFGGGGGGEGHYDCDKWNSTINNHVGPCKIRY